MKYNRMENEREEKIASFELNLDNFPTSENSYHKTILVIIIYL